MKNKEVGFSTIVNTDSKNSELAKFVLPTSSETYLPFFLTKEKPVALVKGMTGSGKTTISMCMAEQHLLAGNEVVYIPFQPVRSAIHPDSEETILALISKYPESFRILKGRNPTILSTLTFKPGALIILEEIHLFSQHGDIALAIENVCKREAGLIITVNSSEQLSDSYPLLNSELIAFLLKGAVREHDSVETKIMKHAEFKYILTPEDHPVRFRVRRKIDDTINMGDKNNLHPANITFH